MKKLNSLPITHIAKTLSEIMDIQPPENCEGEIDALKDYVKEKIDSEKIDKVLIYNPDAIGQWVIEKYPNEFENVEKCAPFKLKMLSVFPPKTPVCFASIYSGASPNKHGICRYTKPVLKIDTLFDALIKAGLKPCIVSVKNQSMDMIFRNRQMDYYSAENDEEVIKIALTLIENSQHDFIAVYNQDYDSAIHVSHPKSKRAIRAVRNYNKYFAMLTECVKQNWKYENSLIAYMPDHGVHREWYLLGQHGKNIPKDMNLIHFYAVFPRLKDKKCK